MSRLKLSLIIGLAMFGIGIVNSLLSAPDTSNGVPIPGYMGIRIVVDGFIAVLCFLGCYLGFRVGHAQRLSFLTGAIIVTSYTVALLVPWFPGSITLNNSGHIIKSSAGFWWSSAAPFVLPFVLALVVPRLPLDKR